ncbi:hypothetical protein NFI96_030244 [Prochilodus magdalenae]|nr:hypothetical protein NFI96_030244 [Prochilodus magdalenae]
MSLVEGLLLQATSTGIILGAVVLLVFVFFFSSGLSFKEDDREPPGPKPLPLLGNLLQLDLDRPHESLCELAQTYGPVFKVYFGPKKVIVLAGYKTVKQALVNYSEEFGEREITTAFKNFEEHGILFSNGENWKEMRRFALSNLRDFGMGKRGSEEKIIEEIHYLKEVLESFGGKPFDTTQPVNYAVSNIISSIVYGSRFEYSDPQFKEMVKRANENVRIGGSAAIRVYNVFPWIGPFLKSRRKMLSNGEKNRKQYRELVNALQETLNPDDRRGFVDSFLLRKQSDEQSGHQNSRFNEKNLFTTVANLFVAGTDTTGTTLRWGLLLMAKYPHIQDRVQEEIERVIGGRQAVVEDRKNLPYTDAVIHEIQRLANIVPMSLPHTTSCDVHFNGFFIKKGTTVYPLLTSVLRDENEWESPLTFNPKHFLDEQGRFVKKDAFLPFSAGCRSYKIIRRASNRSTLYNLYIFEIQVQMAIVEGLLLQDTSTGIILGFVVLLVVVYFLSFSSIFKEQTNEPPGPKPLPFFGNLLQLDIDRPHESLCKLAKTYGPVFKVYLGPNKVVVLAGYKTVKQALVNYADEFGEREIVQIFKDLSEEHGILFSNGENWKEMRRFALTNLRDFGMGKRGSEDKIIEEIQYLKEVFRSFGGEPFDTTQPVNYAVSNIISSIVYGSRFEYSDPRFKQMVNRANENVRIGGSAPLRLYNIFPWIGPFLRSKRKLERNFEDNKKEIKELVRALQETLNPDDQRGFVDSFLLRKQSDEKSGQKNSRFSEKNLLLSVINLFVAGTDTTGTTLRWGLLLMAKYPHIQDRVQEEIDRVIGGRQAVVEDRRNLPYTDAVIHEIQRLANIVPLSLPHTTSCDVHFNGFFIKKGTTVYPLLTSVLRDENEWESPHTFNPAHFLDEQGRFVKKDAFLPFSAGRRVCLGESLAKMELFLFFTSLLQHFHFTPPPGVSEDQLDLTGVVGITLNPSPHKLCAAKRF